jgi:amidase
MKRREFISLAGAAVALAPVVAAYSEDVAEQPKLTLANDELLAHDAVGLAKLVRKGELSARELVEATAARIERLDGKINAMTTLSVHRALQQSQSISANSVFAGVPTVIKDLADVAGIRRTSGSRMQLSHVPQKSSDYMKALEAAGLNIVGMSNTPEFASIVITDNDAFGPTRNPWRLKYSVGGSSGGSAAAVAAGYVPIAHGTDGAGSIRIPSSCCGLLGMKASRYRMACGEADGVHQFLRTHQSISRTVRDSAALFAATENRASDNPYPRVGLVQGPGKKRLKIAFTSANCFGEEPVTSVRSALADSAKLCADLGHEVVEVSNPLDGEPFFQAIESVGMAKMPFLLAMAESLTGRPAEKSGLLTSLLVQTGRYAQQLPPDSYDNGMAHLRQMTLQMMNFFGSIDVWLTPTLRVEPPLVSQFSPDSNFPDMQWAQNHDLMTYTPFVNALGGPAMSVPLGWSLETGLPIGSHFSAAPGADKLLYELAFELEEARPWRDRWAPNSAKYGA